MARWNPEASADLAKGIIKAKIDRNQATQRLSGN